MRRLYCQVAAVAEAILWFLMKIMPLFGHPTGLSSRPSVAKRLTNAPNARGQSGRIFLTSPVNLAKPEHTNNNKKMKNAPKARGQSGR